MQAKLTVVVTGRPRKAGERYPGGRLKVERRPHGDVRNLGIWHRVRESAVKKYAVMQGEIGRLHAEGKLSDGDGPLADRRASVLTDTAMFLGRRWALQGLPRPTAASPGFEIGHRGISPSVVPSEQQRKAEVEERFYDRLRELVRDPVLWDALFELCVENRHINPTLVPKIAQLADGLAGLFSRKYSRGKGKTPTYWRAE